jgi:hypothetical protein
VRGVLAETDVPYRAEGHCFCTFVHPPRSYVPACQVTDSSSRCGGQSECHPDDGTKNDLNRLFRVFSNNRRAGSSRRCSVSTETTTNTHISRMSFRARRYCFWRNLFQLEFFTDRAREREAMVSIIIEKFGF